jgi:hypothetical protein
MDTDTIEGDGSLHADRKLEAWGTFTGVDAQPQLQSAVTVVSMIDHLKPALITAVGRDESLRLRSDSCNPNTSVTLYDQMELTVTSGFQIEDGDSGSPVLDASGRIVGMISWGDPVDFTLGGGVAAPTIKTVLGFDAWYGTTQSGFDLKCN